MRIEILVEGIDDQTLVSAVEHAIRTVFREMCWPGGWRIIVAPSGIGGRWDVRVHGPAGRHVLSLTVPPKLLPDLIPRRLQESLLHAVSSVSASAVSGPSDRYVREDDQSQDEADMAPSMYGQLRRVM
jgi:hypothetical protein